MDEGAGVAFLYSLDVFDRNGRTPEQVAIKRGASVRSWAVTELVLCAMTSRHLSTLSVIDRARNGTNVNANAGAGSPGTPDCANSFVDMHAGELSALLRELDLQTDADGNGTPAPTVRGGKGEQTRHASS